MNEVSSLVSQSPGGLCDDGDVVHLWKELFQKFFISGSLVFSVNVCCFERDSHVFDNISENYLGRAGDTKIIKTGISLSEVDNEVTTVTVDVDCGFVRGF